MRSSEDILEGRNPVREALRSEMPVEKVFLQKDSRDGQLLTIAKDAKKKNIPVEYVDKVMLDRMSETGHHQGAAAYLSAFPYSSVEIMLENARIKGEPPFLFMLDGIEDPHNLGAVIRTANLAGAHGVILPKNRAAGLTASAARASAGAVSYTPVARVTNLSRQLEELKKEGLWAVCADMNGTCMYDLDLSGPIVLVIGGEGEGVSRLVAEHCDLKAAIPMMGDIDSLNASVAAGVLAFEIVRRRSGR